MAAAFLPTVLPLLVGGCLIALAVFVFRSGRHLTHNLAFSGLYLLSGLKSLFEALVPLSPDLHARAEAFPPATFWVGCSLVAATFMLPLLVLFLLLFPRPVRALAKHASYGLFLFIPSVVFSYWFLNPPGGLDLEQLALALNLVAVLATAAALGILVRTYQTSPDAIERTRAKYVLLGFGPAFVGTWVLAALEYLRYFRDYTSPLQPLIVGYVTPFLELGAAGLTAYAIVKYQLLGVELKFRIGAKYAVTTFGVVAVLFTVNEYVGEFVLEPIFGFTQYYWLVAGVVGGLLFKPLELGAGWLTDHVFGKAKPETGKRKDARAAEIYHAQATYILRDAKVTDREMAFLRNLRSQLGLSSAEAKKIEQRVERILQVDSPRTGLAKRKRASA